MPHLTSIASLSPKQASAVQLIAMGWTRKRIAAQVGIDPGTLSRWRGQHAFQQEVQKLLARAERDVAESFRALKLKAVEQLSVLLDSPNQTVALRAIEMVLARTDLNTTPTTAVKSQDDRINDHFDRVLDELLKA